MEKIFKFAFRYPEKIRKECIFKKIKKSTKSEDERDFSDSHFTRLAPFDHCVELFCFQKCISSFFYIEKSSLKYPRIKGDNIENRKELEARMKVRAKEFATIKNTFKVTHIIKSKKE